MTRIEWNAVGERYFEAGVDRGVLYVDGQPGVPWNGLVSVNENPSGGDVTSYYIDGLKYLDHVGFEEFAATIEAYTYPEEFTQCDGSMVIKNGLFATHQTRKTFDLAYRTRIGNDVNDVDHGYKLHLIYNATANATSRNNDTISESVDPFNFSWDVVTKAPAFAGVKPTAHFIIDSRKTPEELLEIIEDILYGSDSVTPRIPSAEELAFIFTDFELGIYDAGPLIANYYQTIDAGVIPEAQTDILDSGGP